MTASFFIDDGGDPVPEYDPKHAWPCQEREHRRFWADVFLRLTAEEFMLWIAQDLQRAEGASMSDRFSHRYNTDARLERLLTPPSARPKGAVRICKASCCRCHVSQEKLSGSCRKSSRS
ncbi:unnamed protein product [Cercospora beticola]|nr:unnamed protein product [Cercospora beticola]